MGSFPVYAPSPNANYLSLWGWNGLGNPPIDDPLSDFWTWWNLFNTNPYSAGTSWMDMTGGEGYPGGSGKVYPGWQGIVDALAGMARVVPPLLGGGELASPPPSIETKPEIPEEPKGPSWPERPETPTGPIEEPGIDPGWLERYPWLAGMTAAAAAAAIAALESGVGTGTEPAAPGEGEPGVPGTEEPTFTSDVYAQPEVSQEALLAAHPELGAVLGGQVPYEPAAPEYPGLPQNPDFIDWGLGFPGMVPPIPSTPIYPELPQNPDFVDWGFTTPYPVPYEPAPVDYGGIVPEPVPEIVIPPGTTPAPETPTPKLPTGGEVPAVSGGGGGAALPPGFPIVGDPNKMRSIFELPIAAVPMQFIKALQLGRNK